MSNDTQASNIEKSDVSTFLTVPEVAEYLGVSKETVRQWIVNGHLPAMRVGLRGTYRVNRVDVGQMVKAA